MQADRVVTAAELDKMSPQERADLIRSKTVRDWADVSGELRAKVNETAKRLGEQRRARA